MASGGARNRSGPKPDPKSRTSERKSYTLTALPAEGFKGPVPKFPLTQSTPRERAVWTRSWRTPQACAWSMPSEAWRIPTVALWVRITVRCEDPNAPASLIGQLHRLADQIGMTTAGLAEMGWAVAVDELGAKRAERENETAEKKKPAPVRRMRAANVQS